VILHTFQAMLFIYYRLMSVIAKLKTPNHMVKLLAPLFCIREILGSNGGSKHL
jgi:hypothetical protein